MRKKGSKANEIEELKKKNEELENHIKRILADYQNLEKRVAEDRQELIKTASKGLILRLLPALDTLMIAKKHTNDQGLNLSIKQLSDILEKEGVKKIDTFQKNFDPKYMECVATVEVDPSTGSGQEGKVIEELKPGYMLNDIILRAAQVSVGHGSK
ncbi:MAG: nucleotide exchange factor GrpE [Candidatus Levybacteria bacterium RIFCSPHIGHO2_01_FULL_37_33]|nr:MAG: nucleotide exchange factor GrpE [Candidatus Levybacteria bacterium RIFCSPHIGHO2_01_FULL_37_33]OGH32523.1 MAG: nucleotide exchange factor GrpE [Candidatus Levybacteria bacterium RIFCSPLOWO2_01_FULL_36_54]